MKNAEWMLKHGMKFSNLKWGYINGKNVVYYEDYINGISAEPLYYESGRPKDIVKKWLDMERTWKVCANEMQNNFINER